MSAPVLQAFVSVCPKVNVWSVDSSQTPCKVPAPGAVTLQEDLSAGLSSCGHHVRSGSFLKT